MRRFCRHKSGKYELRAAMRLAAWIKSLPPCCARTFTRIAVEACAARGDDIVRECDIEAAEAAVHAAPHAEG